MAIGLPAARPKGSEPGPEKSPTKSSNDSSVGITRTGAMGIISARQQAPPLSTGCKVNACLLKSQAQRHFFTGPHFVKKQAGPCRYKVRPCSPKVPARIGKPGPYLLISC